MKFRKRPVVVDAWPIAALVAIAEAGRWEDLPEPVRDAYLEGRWRLTDRGLSGERSIVVVTLEGDMLGPRTDWLIRGTRGEWYPCKPEPFADTFEFVDDDGEADEVPFREAGDADPTSRCYLEACTLGPHPRGTEHRTWRASPEGSTPAR